MSDSQIKLVRRSHPTVTARVVTWEMAASKFPKCGDEDTLKVRSTTFYGIAESEADSILTRQSVEEGLWMLGPYPDGGFWFVRDLGKYEVAQVPNVSLMLAALRHLQRAVMKREHLEHLSDIVDVDALDPDVFDSICESVNFGDRPVIATGEKAHYVCEFSVIDPDSNAPVEVSIYKDQKSSGLFGIDCSYLETLSEDDPVLEPFSGTYVTLIDGPYGSSEKGGDNAN